MSSSSELNKKGLEQFQNTIVTNLIIFAFIWILFEANRNFKLIYYNRVKDKPLKENRVPPAPPKTPLGWIWQINKVSEDDILRMLGLDAYVYLRYIHICFRLSFIGSLMAVVILMPVYAHCGNHQTGWNQYTVANIPTDKFSSQQKLWVTVFFTYVYASYFMYLMYEEYKLFVVKRQQFMLKGDFSTHPQTYYTVMIEKVPSQIRTVDSLKKYFDSIFPDQIYSAEICLELHELEALAVARHDVRNNLEKAIAVWKATDNRETVWVKQDCYEGYEDPPHEVKQCCIPNIFGYHVYDAIEHWTKQLTVMNNRVGDLQKLNLEYTHRMSSRNLDTSRFSQFTNQLSQNAPFKATRDTEEGNGDLKSSLLSNDSLGEVNSSGKGEVALSNDFGRASGQIENKQNRESTTSSVFDAITAVPKSIVNTGVDIITSIGNEGLNTVRLATTGVVKGLHKATRTLELLTIGADYKVSNTAFITFTTRQAQTTTHQILLSHKYEYFNMVITNAPSSSDVVWENVSIPLEQYKLRKNITDIGLYIGALFWLTIVQFINIIGNLNGLAHTKTFHFLAAYTRTEFFLTINSFLASLLLLIFLMYLPTIFEIISLKYEGMKLHSEVQNVLFIRYFYYQLANVFTQVVFGSFINDISQISSLDSIPNILGESIPRLSAYFANLVITYTFTFLPLQMLRISPLLQMFVVKLFVDKKKYTRRELRTGIFGNDPFEYGQYYPNLMMILMIMSIYFSISPIIMPFCCFFFGISYWIYKYQLLYIFVNPYESGGFMWYAVFNRSMICLMGGVFILFCYLLIQGNYERGPILPAWGALPLPFIVYYFKEYCDKKFQKPSMTLSLETAISIDASLRQNPTEAQEIFGKFSEIRYRQPSLSEPDVKPEAYRRKKDDRSSTTAVESLLNLNLGSNVPNERTRSRMDSTDEDFDGDGNHVEKEHVEAEVDTILDNSDDTSEQLGRDLESSSNYANK